VIGNKPARREDRVSHAERIAWERRLPSQGDWEKAAMTGVERRVG
jgi:hypothetical protein